MSQADEPSYAELKRLYAELVLECAAAKDQNVAYRLKIQDMETPRELACKFINAFDHHSPPAPPLINKK